MSDMNAPVKVAMELEAAGATPVTDAHRPQQRRDSINRDNWRSVEVIARADELTKLQTTIS